MKSRVRRLLQPAGATRKTYSVTMGSDQVEMIDKLALFFGRETGQKISRNQLIEEAVGGFIDDSMEIIRETYDMDIRCIPLAALDRSSSLDVTNVAELDTVILPAKDNAQYREDFFVRRQWGNIRIVEEKLACMRYLAIYVGAPTSGITHYAGIASYQRDPDHSGRYMILLDGAPQALQHTVAAGDPSLAAGMRSCRYTALHVLQCARSLQDLFAPFSEL